MFIKINKRSRIQCNYTLEVVSILLNSHLRFQIRIWDLAVSNTTWDLTSDSKSRKFPIQLQIWIWTCWSQILIRIISVKHSSTCKWITLIKYTGYIKFPIDGLYLAAQISPKFTWYTYCSIGYLILCCLEIWNNNNFFFITIF